MSLRTQLSLQQYRDFPWRMRGKRTAGAALSSVWVKKLERASDANHFESTSLSSGQRCSLGFDYVQAARDD